MRSPKAVIASVLRVELKLTDGGVFGEGLGMQRYYLLNAQSRKAPIPIKARVSLSFFSRN
jgi:hypothetical protein